MTQHYMLKKQINQLGPLRYTFDELESWDHWKTSSLVCDWELGPVKN